MRAIRVHEFGGPDVLKLETVDDREPGAGDIAIRVRAIGVNPVDTYIRSGAHAVRPQLPYTPGFDAAGEVERVGPTVAGVAAGDRVYVATSDPRTYAERIICAAATVHPLPDRVSFAQGAALGVPYATAYRALFQRGGARPGETVLVHGATGGVGTATVELARASGLNVIATGGTDKGLAAVRERGAHFTVNHRADN